MYYIVQVPGRFQLKGHEKLQQLNELYAEGIQFMPHQRKEVTYVSRLEVNPCSYHSNYCVHDACSISSLCLQCVQAAVDDQLTTLFKNNPSERVALITFNSEVRFS